MTNGTHSRAFRLRAWLVIAVIALGYSLAPIAAYGQESTSTDTTTSTTEVSEPKPPKPIGSIIGAYDYVPETNRWESKYYIWDHENRREIPKYDTQVYNEETGLFDTYRWIYSPAQDEYFLSIKRAVPPEPEVTDSTTDSNPETTAGSIESTGPSSTNSSTGNENTISNTGPDSNNEIDSNDDSSINTTGPESNNTIDDDSSLDYNYDDNIDTTINNNVNGVAQSGDAAVSLNTQAGDASTGDAQSNANLINMLQSSWSPLNGGSDLSTFNVNLQGDIVGDMLIDPGQFDGMQNSNYDTANYDVNIATDNTINNNINLDSQSGDATVSMNTKGGDASTGDASSMANVINMINSMIAAGDSFVGSITVDGDFEGDILLPEDAIDQLLASNSPTGGAASIDTTGPDSTNTIDSSSNIDTDISIANNSDINNNLNLNAASGDATVRSNTDAGDASTGDAQTNVNILNISNQNYITENSLLVFVNVYGEWVGIIMDAPVGATSAALGGGVASSALAPTGYGSVDTNIDIDNQNTINNNINLNSQSGNAMVTNNTQAGDATTGNAFAGANIANVTNSSFGASNWFGVLFINILGDWLGSFNVNTDYGNPLLTSNNSQQEESGVSGDSSNVKVFRFVPKTSQQSTTTTTSPNANTQFAVVQESFQQDSGTQTVQTDQQVESATTITQPVDIPEQTNPPRNWTPFIFSTLIAGLILAGPRVAGSLRSFLF